jgi:hypothetical protein
MRRIPEAKLPLPKFASEEEEARYWATHSAAGVWEKLPRGKPVKLLPSLARAIRDRQALRKAAVSVRLGPDEIERVKKIGRVIQLGGSTINGDDHVLRP